jgi:branched-chain amino acid transport system substrate-binding protein
MFRVLMALPYEYPSKKVVIINTDDSWGIEVGDTLVSSFKKKAGKCLNEKPCLTAPMNGVPF